MIEFQLDKLAYVNHMCDVFQKDFLFLFFNFICELTFLK